MVQKDTCHYIRHNMQMFGVIPFISLLNLFCVWIEGRELNLNALVSCVLCVYI